MSTEQYAMVRGSAIRITALESCGGIPDDVIRYAAAKCITRVSIGELVEAAGNEIIRDSEDDPALHFVTEAEILGYNIDIEFMKVNPAVLSLVTGIEQVTDWEGEDVIGFDNKMRVKAPAFALEVWSRIAGQVCAVSDLGFGEGPFGEMPFGGSSDGGVTSRKYGYTLFPFLKGGYITGYEISNGLVSFKVVGAQTRWGSSWGRGPYDLTGESFVRLPSEVSSNLSWRNLILLSPPPSETEGIVEMVDVIDNGNAANPNPLATGTVDGEDATTTSSGLVEGGHAA